MIRYSEEFNNIGRLIILALRARRCAADRAEIVDLYSRLDLEQCLACARDNHVEAAVSHALLAEVPEAAEQPLLRRIIDSNRARVEGLLLALDEAVAQLEESGCCPAVIENGGVLLGTEMDAGIFCSADFDILIMPGTINAAIEAFARAGFHPADRRNRPTSRVEFFREEVGGQRFWLNAGSEPFDRMWIPLVYRNPVDRWLRSRIPATKGRGLHVLNPADALSLVAVHISLHSFVRAPGIRLHTDVDWLVREAPIDWDRFIRTVKGIGLLSRVFVSLSMAAGLLETPIPDHVLSALYIGDRRWQTLRRLLSHEGILVDGRRKLTGVRAIALDRLIDEQGLVGWCASLLFPPAGWLREHFDRDGSQGWSPWRLNLERFRLFATRWRREVR